MRTTTKHQGLRPIGANMPAAIRQIADAAIVRQGLSLEDKNRVDFRAFIDREIAAAMAMEHAEGLAHLGAVQRRLRAAQASMMNPGRIWRACKGLHAWDFVLADGEIAMAERAIAPNTRQVAA